MRDLKIKPGMDTPKAKLKNPAPKDADSLLKQHMAFARFTPHICRPLHEGVD